MEPEKNPILSRYVKFIGPVVAGLVELANVWTGGPPWLYAAASVAAAAWVVAFPNAPKYKVQQPAAG